MFSYTGVCAATTMCLLVSRISVVGIFGEMDAETAIMMSDAQDIPF